MWQLYDLYRVANQLASSYKKLVFGTHCRDMVRVHCNFDYLAEKCKTIVHLYGVTCYDRKKTAAQLPEPHATSNIVQSKLVHKCSCRERNHPKISDSPFFLKRVYMKTSIVSRFLCALSTFSPSVKGEHQLTSTHYLTLVSLHLLKGRWRR